MKWQLTHFGPLNRHFALRARGPRYDHRSTTSAAKTPSKRLGDDEEEDEDLHPLALSVRSMTATLLKLLEFDPSFSSVLVMNNFLDQYVYQILSKVSIGATSGAQLDRLDEVGESSLKVTLCLLRGHKGCETFADLFFSSLIQSPVKFLKAEVAELALAAVEAAAKGVEGGR